MKQVTVLLAVLFLFIGDVSAQTPTDHELGFRFNSFRDFSLIYKKHLNENKYLRIRSVNSNLGISSFATSLGLGVAVGREKRVDVRSNLQFVHGPELGGFYSFYNRKDNDMSSSNASVSLGYIFGLQCTVRDNIRFGLEAIPSVTSSFSFDGDGYVDDSSSFNFTSGWGSASVYVLYAFSGKEK